MKTLNLLSGPADAPMGPFGPFNELFRPLDRGQASRDRFFAGCSQRRLGSGESCPPLPQDPVDFGEGAGG
jgi:hypothetical protein